MERYLLVPDSFKGTLSSREICDILREEILRARPMAEVLAFPVADGGEGSVDAFLAAVGGERIEVPCHGPHMEEMTGFYGLLPDGTAVVEMAAAAGLPLVGDRLEPDRTTTYGVGERHCGRILKYKSAAVENNITNGISATEFGVETVCNRAQVVTFLCRAYEK